MDTAKLRELLDQRDKIDDEIKNLVNGEDKEKRTIKCGKCQQEGHNARACTNGG